MKREQYDRENFKYLIQSPSFRLCVLSQTKTIITKAESNISISIMNIFKHSNFWRIYQQTGFESKLGIFLSLHCALLPWQQLAAYIHRPQNIQQTNCRHILNSNLAATSQDDEKGVVLNQLGSGFCDSKTEG